MCAALLHNPAPVQSKTAFVLVFNSPSKPSIRCLKPSLLSSRPGRKRDYTPVLWSQYFESMEDVVIETDSGKDISSSSVVSFLQ